MEEVRTLGESDWDDQDLLTLDEAQFRLKEEIDVVSKELAALTNDSDPATSQRLEKRLQLLHQLHERYSAPAD